MQIIDPKWIRVSHILNMIPSLGSDGKWSYPMQALDQDKLQRKAELGSCVHAAIAAEMKGEFLVCSDKEQGYVDSYLKWKKSINLQCHDVETRFYYEPMNLTGCVDMIGKMHSNGLYHVIDFKCTVAPDHKKWPLQGAFYAFLAQVNGLTLDKKCLFVQLDEYGDYPKIHEYEITKELTQMAISLYNAYMYLTRN